MENKIEVELESIRVGEIQLGIMGCSLVRVCGG